MQIRSLGWEDPLEEGMATHSTILAWRIPWTEEPGRLQSKGSHRARNDWDTKHNSHRHLSPKFFTFLNWSSVRIKHQTPIPRLHSIHQHLPVFFLTMNLTIQVPHISGIKQYLSAPTLAWKTPWTEEPGGLQSMGSLRVGHDWSDLAAAVYIGMHFEGWVYICAIHRLYLLPPLPRALQ